MPGIEAGKSRDCVRHLRDLLDSVLSDNALDVLSQEWLIEVLQSNRILARCEILCVSKTNDAIEDKQDCSREAHLVLNSWRTRVLEVLSSEVHGTAQLGAILLTVTAEQCDHLCMLNCSSWAVHLLNRFERLFPKNPDSEKLMVVIMKCIAFLAGKAKLYPEASREFAATIYPRFLKRILQLGQSYSTSELESAKLTCLSDLLRISSSMLSNFMTQIEDFAVSRVFSHPELAAQLLAVCSSLEVKASRTVSADGTIRIGKAAGCLSLRALSSIHHLLECSSATSAVDVYKPTVDTLPRPFEAPDLSKGVLPMRRAVFMRHWKTVMTATTHILCYPHSGLTRVPFSAIIQLLLRVFNLPVSALPKASLITVLTLPKIFASTIELLLALLRRFNTHWQPYTAQLKDLYATVEGRAAVFPDCDILHLRLLQLSGVYICELNWMGLSDSMVSRIVSDLAFTDGLSGHNSQGLSESDTCFEDMNSLAKRQSSLRVILRVLQKAGSWIPVQLRNQIDRAILDFLMEDDFRCYNLVVARSYTQLVQQKVALLTLDNRLLALKCIVASAMQQVLGQVPTLPYVLYILKCGLLRERAIATYCEQAILLLQPIFRPRLPAMVPPGMENPLSFAESATENVLGAPGEAHLNLETSLGSAQQLEEENEKFTSLSHRSNELSSVGLSAAIQGKTSIKSVVSDTSEWLSAALEPTECSSTVLRVPEKPVPSEAVDDQVGSLNEENDSSANKISIAIKDSVHSSAAPCQSPKVEKKRKFSDNDQSQPKRSASETAQSSEVKLGDKSDEEDISEDLPEIVVTDTE